MSSARCQATRRHRSSVAVLLMAVAAMALALFPAAAQAKRGGIIGFAATNQSPRAASTEPAIGHAPGTSRSEWFVVSNGTSSSLLSISRSGQIRRVTRALGSGATSGTARSAAPGYGSAVVDGYTWIVRYGSTTSPLYAVSPSGTVTRVTTNVGADITDITAGPNATLSFSSSDPSVEIQSCQVSVAHVPSCASVLSIDSLLSGLTGFLSGHGQVQSITADKGLLWFTDAKGQVGSFNLLSWLVNPVVSLLQSLVGGPYGDTGSGASAVGEGSPSANTITANRNGYLYIAGGRYQSATGGNNRILKVDPATGKTVTRYTRDLTDVTAITSGPNGTVWFLDRTSRDSGRIGELNTRTGRITEYKLPKGFRFEGRIAQIAPGPAGSGTVYFTLETTSGKPAIGEVRGL